jgi:hypothetical protein
MIWRKFKLLAALGISAVACKQMGMPFQKGALVTTCS